MGVFHVFQIRQTVPNRATHHNSVIKQIEESNAVRLLIDLWSILAIVSKFRF